MEIDRYSFSSVTFGYGGGVSYDDVRARIE
jgi:hypothetical protein